MIGVGKLGQDCAEVMAAAGYDVVGYDVAPRTPAFPMLASIENAVKDRDFIFIAAPTPHDPMYGGEKPTSHLPNKDFDYSIVTAILTEVNKFVNKNQLVVLISTVLPGTVRNQLEPCITNARFIYNPYLIAMGTIKWDMVNPEMIIIGTEDGNITGDAAELIDFYKVFMNNDPRYEVGTWDEAESIKIFYNTFISTKLALVNMIQDVAEENGNINVDIVTRALSNSTQRIMGPAYMTAGLGDAGACHPRDNIALRYLADRLELGYDLFDSIMTAREVQAERMALRCLKNGKNVTIIGKAYKPGVSYTNGSASMLVGHYIEKHGGTVNYYDENTGDLDLRKEWTEVYLIGYWEEWVERAFVGLNGIRYAPVVIDPWRKQDGPLKVAGTHNQNEVIYYGDTRKKTKYGVSDTDKEYWYTTVQAVLFRLWPDLAKYNNTIHLIDAEIGPTNFILRPTESIVKEVLAAKNSGKTKFMFCNLSEGYIFKIVDKIHRIANLVAEHVDSKNIFYLCSSVRAEESYNNTFSTLEETPTKWKHKISILSSRAFQLFAQLDANAPCLRSNTEYLIKEKDKDFLCFNRNPNRHRLQLVDRMLEHGLINRGYYSFDPPNHPSWLTSISTDEFKNIKLHESLFPIRLNMTPNINPSILTDADMRYFDNSYFSIVTESMFYNTGPDIAAHQWLPNKVFMTEKIFKPIAALHPFITLSAPGSLAELRELGYKTFSPMIDETYDTIIDPYERFDAIYQEINRLSHQTTANWIQWQTDIKLIVEHNRNHFHTNTNYLSTPIKLPFE